MLRLICRLLPLEIASFGGQPAVENDRCGTFCREAADYENRNSIDSRARIIYSF